jgi:hypothetical protein
MDRCSKSASTRISNAFVIALASFSCVANSFTTTDRWSTTTTTRNSIYAVAPVRMDERIDDFRLVVYNDNETVSEPTIQRRDVTDILCINDIGEKGNEPEESTFKDPRNLCERRRRAMAAEVLRRPFGVQQRNNNRWNSDSDARSETRTTSERVLNAMRKSILQPGVDMNSRDDDGKAPLKVTRSAIQSAIEEMMENHTSRARRCSDDASSITTSLRSFAGTYMGILGDQQDRKAGKERTDISKLTIIERDKTVIRMASSLDDMEIANLRLSVFADFTLQQRNQFCTCVSPKRF